ncbi:hypothetical protein GW17_00057295, partial [Ensete ventricosum]
GVLLLLNARHTACPHTAICSCGLPTQLPIVTRNVFRWANIVRRQSIVTIVATLVAYAAACGRISLSSSNNVGSLHLTITTSSVRPLRNLLYSASSVQLLLLHDGDNRLSVRRSL